MEKNIIERLNLTETEVINIVSEWYINGTYPDILQDEDGYDLCEITHRLWERKRAEEIKQLNLKIKTNEQKKR